MVTSRDVILRCVKACLISKSPKIFNYISIAIFVSLLTINQYELVCWKIYVMVCHFQKNFFIRAYKCFSVGPQR